MQRTVPFVGAVPVVSGAQRTLPFGGALAPASAGGTAPSITVQPTNQTAVEGTTATFSFTATGTGSLTAQARKNGVNIGAPFAVTSGISANYTTPTLVLAENGSTWDFVVSGDTAPPATSNAATLTVNAAADTTPPVIIGPTGAAGAASISISVAENTTACGTWIATDTTLPISWDIVGGADAARFSISSINQSSGALTFVAAPDFETPTDVGGNNVYDVVLRARDAVTPTPNASTQSVAVTVTNASEAPVFIGTNIADISIKRGQTVTPVDVSGRFSDPEGATLTFSVSPAGSAWPSGLVVSSAGVVTGTLSAAPGVYSGLRVRGTDPGGLTVDSNAFTVTVTQALLALNNPYYRLGSFVASSHASVDAIDSLSGCVVEVYADTAPEGAVLAVVSGLSTNASGHLSDLPHDALMAGTFYSITISVFVDSVWRKVKTRMQAG